MYACSMLYASLLILVRYLLQAPVAMYASRFSINCVLSLLSLTQDRLTDTDTRCLLNAAVRLSPFVLPGDEAASHALLSRQLLHPGNLLQVCNAI